MTSQLLQYHPVDLFGGAIRAPLPTTFADVSDIRQVPDNQEVYLDKEGFTSVTVDILERVDAASDQEALKVHLQDVCGGDADGDGGVEGEGVKAWTTSEVVFAKIPQGTPAYTLLATSPPGAKQVGRPNEPVFVAILLTLIRLEDKATDLVLTINVPHLPGEYDEGSLSFGEGRMGPLMTKAVEMRGRLVEGLEVREWGLFV